MKIFRPAILLVFLILMGCSDPKETIIPQDPDTWEKELKPKIEKLNEEDKKLIAKYLAGSMIRAAFNGETKLTGTETIGSAIEKQKAADAAEVAKEKAEKELKAKLEAQQAQIKKQFDKVILVTFLEKKLVKADYSSQIEFLVGVENKSDKAIVGFKGVVNFYNIFGDKIYSINITDDNSFKPKEAARLKYYVDYNQFMDEDNLIVSTDPQKLKFEFIPETVIFSDGAKLEMPK